MTMNRLIKYILFTALMVFCLMVQAQRQKPVPARVMTFNIRLENKNDGQNNWELRFQKVSNFLNKSKADIIGLQEVKYVQLADISNILTNYDGVGVGRDDGKEKGEYNPIFYSRNKYNMLRCGTFWLSETPNQPSRGWDAACNRIATWVILQDKTTLKSVLVLNTHLDHIGHQARINSAALIKEKLGRMVNDIPVIITGDFNVDENDPVYSKITSSIFPLNDVWKETSNKKGPEITFHDFGKIKNEDGHKIDFIFVSSQIKVKAAAVIETALGDGFFLSDHNAHGADIIF